MALNEAKKKYILKQLNSNIVPTTPPALQLSVTGSKLDLQTNKRVSLLPATPPPLEGSQNPWQHSTAQENKQEEIQRGKELLVTLNAPPHHSHSKIKKGHRISPRSEKLSLLQHRHKLSGGPPQHKHRGAPPKPHPRRSGSKSVQMELRQTHMKMSITRKYFMKWTRKVFGRILPSVARQYYAMRCKRQVLGAWLEVWWVEHKEWKLRIRAECHDRYRLWILIWKAWVRKVQDGQNKRLKISESEEFYCGRLKGGVLSAWKNYCVKRKEKNKCRDFTREWRQDTIVRTSWLRWKYAFHHCLSGRAMDLVALNTWANNLQRKTLLKWRVSYHAKRETARKTTSAVKHSDRTLQKCFMKGWLNYVSARRSKLYLRGVAFQFHQSSMMEKCFFSWKDQFLEIRRMAEFEELIAQRSGVAISRRAFQKWKYYIALKEHKSHLLELARVHYSLSLVSKALSAFLRYHHLQRKISRDKQLALHFHMKAKCKEVWRKWLERCEDNEEAMLGSLTRQARAHSSAKMKHKAMEGWLVYVSQCRHWKRLEGMADLCYRENALPRYFRDFREGVSISIYKGHLKEESKQFRSETLLSIGFYKWWRESRLSRDVRMLERVATLHWEGVIKKRSLQTWRGRGRERLLHSHLEELATTHCLRWQLRNAFTRWYFQWEAAVSSARNMKKATHHASLRLKSKAWTLWMEHVEEQRRGHAHRKYASDHYHRLLLSKVLQHWQVYHSLARVKTSKTAVALCLHHRWLKKKALMKWRRTVQVTKHGTELLRLAAHHHSRNSILKCFRDWKDLAVQGKEQKQREDDKVDDVVASLFRLKGLRILLTWKHYARERTVKEINTTISNRHYQHLLRVKVFASWRSHHQMLLRKELLTRQGVWFERARLLSMCYSKWRTELMSELRDKQKRTMSLWHWSQVLEGRVLRAWLHYTAERQRKAGRYSSALDRHRSWLIGLGVKQWIKAATHSKARREDEAMKMQAKNSQKVLKCVRRCAQHWRELTLRHRPHPLPPRPISLVADQTSTHLWNTLSRHLELPTDGVPVHRPQPRKYDFTSSFSESLPRLLPPPPPPQFPHKLEGGNSCLNVTADPFVLPGEQVTLPYAKGKHNLFPYSRDSQFLNPQSRDSQFLNPQSRDSQFLNPQSRDSQFLNPQSRDSQFLNPQSRDSQFLNPQSRDSQLLNPQSRDPETVPIPPSRAADLLTSGGHPLRGKAVQEDILAMRDQMRKFLELNIHLKSLQDQVSVCKQEEREKVQSDLHALEQLVRESEPGVRELAGKINKLLQLCS